MRIELIENISRLLEIVGDWEELLTRSPARDIFLTPQWVIPWWKVFGEGKYLFFVALWEGKKLSGLFPLCRVNKGPFRILTFAGLPNVADRMDFVLVSDHEEKHLRFFSQWILSMSGWDILYLRNFGSFSKNPEIFHQVLNNLSVRCTSEIEGPCFFISTSDYNGFDDYLESTLKPRKRSDLRRSMRRLTEHEGAEWEVLDCVDDDMLNEMEEIECKRSTRGLSGLGFFQNPENKGFLKMLLNELHRLDMVRAFVFRIGGKLYSYALTFKYDDKILGYQTAFDRTLSKYSLGTLTILESIRYTFENRWKECDFLRGGEEFKGHFTGKFRQNNFLCAYREGMRSYSLYLYHKKVRPIRRKFANYPLLKKVVPDWIKKLDI